MGTQEPKSKIGVATPHVSLRVIVRVETKQNKRPKLKRQLPPIPVSLSRARVFILLFVFSTTSPLYFYFSLYVVVSLLLLLLFRLPVTALGFYKIDWTVLDYPKVIVLDRGNFNYFSIDFTLGSSNLLIFVTRIKGFCGDFELLFFLLLISVLGVGLFLLVLA